MINLLLCSYYNLFIQIIDSAHSHNAVFLLIILKEVHFYHDNL